MLQKLDDLGYHKCIFLVFIIGFVIRLIPDLLSFPYPIGWDTIYYAYRINDGALFGYWNDPFSTWLPYGILIFLGNLTQLDPFLILKIFSALLYGGSTAGIFFVAWKKLNWSVTKSTLLCVLFAFQLAALTISWQFLRNVFGVMLLLFTIPFIKSDIGWKGTAGLSALGLLIAWGHELAAVSLIFMVFGLLFHTVWKHEKVPYRLFVAIIPALFLFVGNFLYVSPFPNSAPRNLVWLPDSVWAHPGGLFFLTDYLNVSTPIESYGSYFDLFYQVGSLFVLLYAIILPLIGAGYFKDRVFNSWILLLLVGSFGLLIFPFAALLLWGRWMLMLVYPFSFFAANGLWKAMTSLKGVSVSRFIGFFSITKKVGTCLALVSIIIGGLFMAWPLIDGRYGVIGWGGTFKYVPSTMQSSSVPLQDTQGVIEAFEWLNENMNSNSSLLVHDVFEFWTLLYLDNGHTGFVFDNNLEDASNYALEEGFKSAYFLWWNQDIGWYNLRVTDDYASVFDNGRISVFQVF